MSLKKALMIIIVYELVLANLSVKCCKLVQFSCSVVSDSLRPPGLQHIRLPCPSTAPGACWLVSTELVMPSNHLILCHPLLLLPSISPSIRVFSNESVLHNSWPKDWSFSFSNRPSNVYPGLISIRMDWLDILAVQGTLKSLLQYQSSKASILQHSVFLNITRWSTLKSDWLYSL